MEDNEKTREQLIEEIKHLRSQVTEFETLESRRKKEEERLRFLSFSVEQSTEGIAIVNLEGDLLFVNNAFATMHGYTPEEIQGKHFSIFHTAEQMPSVEVANREIEETGEFNGEIWHVRKDDTVFPTWMHNSLIRDEAGNPTGLIGTLRDITERKKGEEELKREKELAEQYLSIAEVGLMIVNADENITLINKKGCGIIGYKEEELIGKNWFDLLVPQRIRGEIKDVFRKLMAGDIKLVEYYENPLLTKDGEERLIAFHNTVIRDSDGQIVGVLFSAEDITERKKAEEKIKEQNIFLVNILESLTHPFYVMDVNDYAIKMANSAAYLGKSSKDLTCYSLIHRRERPCEGEHLCPLEEVKKTKKAVVVEHIHYEEDGSIGNMEVHGHPIFDKEGNVVQMIEYALDITERKKAEETLRDSEERLKILFEFAPDAIYLNDLRGIFVGGNKAAEELTGYKREELIGKNFLELKLLPPSQIPKAAMLLAKNVLCQSTGPDEFILNRKDGSTVTVEIRTFPVKIRGETSILGIARDITKRKRAEEEIISYQKKIEALINSSRDLIFLKDKDFRYLIANKSHEKLFGIKIKDIIGKTDFDFMSKEVAEGCGKSDREVLETENPVEKEEMINDRCFQVIKQKVVNEKRDIIGIAAVIRDITEHKKADRRLEETYQKLKETQEQLIQSGKMAAMGQLAAGISHELNQPLTGIKGFAQTILVDIEEGKLMREDVEKIIEQTDRMDRIIKNIRFFARRSEFKIEELDINQSIENSLMLLEEQLRVHNIHLKKSLGEGLPKIKGDSNQLQQVFLNMITNARDAIDSLKNPSCGELIVESFLSEDKNNVEIIFQDTGCGISKENLGNVFNPFFTTKSPDGGIGLGLSIAYRIIENHRGRIEVFSEEGKGATFKITLPISSFDA